MSDTPTLLRKILIALALATAFSLTPFREVSAVVSNTATQTITSLGNGSTVNYTIGFAFQANGDVHVFLQDQSVSPYTQTEVLQGAGATKFTITGGDPGTTVHMGTAPSTVQRLIIKRTMALTQTVDYVETDAFPAEDHETAMDKQTMLVQQLESEISTKVGLGATSTATAPTVPDPSADKFLIYNHGGTDLTLAPSTASTSGDVLKYNGSAWVPYALDTETSSLQSQINAHTSNTSNPHNVTASQVGSNTAQWNANKIQSVTVDDSSKADGRILQYQSSSGNLIYAPAATAATLTSGHIFVGNGSNAATDVAVSGDATLSNTGSLTVSSVGGKSAATANTANTLALRDASGNFSAGTITAALSGNATNITGVALVANGGTGASTLALNGVVVGNGTSMVQVAPAGTTGQVLTATTGSAPTFQTPAATNNVSPAVQTFNSTATFNEPYAFIITSGSATVSSTYTNNSVTFTTLYTVASGTLVYMTGSSPPAASGTLTKASGTGDSTITFSTYKAPLYLHVKISGPGGGGSSSGTGSNNAGGSGSAASTFGSTLFSAGAGAGGGIAVGVGGNAGAGGTSSLAAPAYGTCMTGNGGMGGSVQAQAIGYGPAGGAGYFLGGAQSIYNSTAGAGATNSGSGGGGGGSGNAGAGAGTGGGGGGACDGIVPSALSNTYAIVIGTGGTGGSAGTSGTAGGAGAAGAAVVWAYYQ